MFRSARIKLTAWYLLIIMLISISFSLGMYNIINSELERVQRVQITRLEGRVLFFRSIPQDIRDQIPRSALFDPDLVQEAKNRLIITLGLINLAILAASGFAGYFLAGRTLRPIKKMMDEQNRFITDASHELLTPLTSLKSEIEVNLRNKNLTLEEAKKLFASNLEEVNNLQLLSDGLIELTKFHKPDVKQSFSDLALDALINNAILKVSVIAKKKNINIVNRTRNFFIKGHGAEMVKLFVIFLDNAIKYSPRDTEVKISSEKEDGYVVISITDQGIGIDEKDIPYIFDRFYRADKSRTKTNVKGYGIGLSIAKAIVDKQNGYIKVKSKKGKGTQFKIYLPFANLL